MSALTGMAKMMVLAAYLSEESRRVVHGDRQDATARASSTATDHAIRCVELPEKFNFLKYHTGVVATTVLTP